MATIVYSKEQQASGQFNGGEILENKPIGFPQDGGSLRPYSNLFYWAHAWTPEVKSLIGEHPHQGFEILSFVISGSLSHYDDKADGWESLKAGDVQVIRSGKGIRHAEMVNRESSFFQIWFDPDLSKSMSHDPSYDNYSAHLFPRFTAKGMSRVIYKGKGSPLQMLTPGVEIYELIITGGRHSMPINSSIIRSVYLMEGDLILADNTLAKDDFAVTRHDTNYYLQSRTGARLFVIDTPAQPGYKTYAEYNGINHQEPADHK
jgi:redox-sensitive bicupin YhaK (pirin superfamily)